MRFWLFTANPTAQGFGACKTIEDVREYQEIISDWDNWSTRSKRLSPGDMFCLMLQGQGRMNGIIAYGKVLTEPYAAPGWRYSQDKAWYVDIMYKSTGIFVPLEALKKRFPDQFWSPQSSGISIKAKYTRELLELLDPADKESMSFS